MPCKIYLISFFLLFGRNSKSYCQSQQNLIASDSANLVHIDFRQRYIYNHSRDTIFFPDIDPYSLCTCDEPRIISEIQIDGMGSKEIVFYRNCIIKNTFYVSSFAQKTTLRLKKYEVWNLDNKTLLFEATNYCKGQSSGTQPNRFGELKPSRKNLYYQYNFSIDKTGKIELKHLRGKQKEQVKLQQGVYLFEHGKYNLQK